MPSRLKSACCRRGRPWRPCPQNCSCGTCGHGRACKRTLLPPCRAHGSERPLVQFDRRAVLVACRDTHLPRDLTP
eukprot:scaffold261567_cov35-Tisochrysis_lutea.AAC.2